MRKLYAELFALAQEELAYFKAPGWFAAVENLPLTGTQKLQRGPCRACYTLCMILALWLIFATRNRVVHRQPGDSMTAAFDDIVVTTPTSIAYRRFSNEFGALWLLSALRDMLVTAKLQPSDIDGLTV